LCLSGARIRDVAAMDQALEMLAGCGPEFGGIGLSNHGPMAAEALSALGREQEVEPWVERYRKRLIERPPKVEHIDALNWPEVLGEVDSGEPGRARCAVNQHGLAALDAAAHDEAVIRGLVVAEQVARLSSVPVLLVRSAADSIAGLPDADPDPVVASVGSATG